MTPQNAKPTPFLGVMKFGVAGGLISILISAGLRAMNLTEDNWIVRLLSFMLFILIIILSIQHQRDRIMGGYIRYSRAVGTGMLTAFIMDSIIVIFMFIFMHSSIVLADNFLMRLMFEALLVSLVASLFLNKVNQTKENMKQEEIK